MKSTLLAVFSLWTGLTVFSSRAEAACNWNLEIFKAKISDSCQAEFMGKLTDEQDRIYSRRMFKDWNLPKGTEVSVEPGFLQVSNTETGELYQVAWLSDKPLMMWIDGVVVSDASSDTSIFRRIEKLYKKAHEEAQARRDPVRTFLFGNDAYAELMGPDLPLTNLYHVNGYTGTASDFLATRDQNLKGLFGNSEWASSWLSSWTSGRSNTCVANKIDDFKTDIDGKPVTIHQVTKTEFTVTGLVPGKSVKVDMNPSATGVAVATGSGKSSKQKKKKKKNSYIATYACDGRYSVDSDSQCKDAWTDYVSKHPDIKSKFDSVLSAMVARIKSITRVMSRVASFTTKARGVIVVSSIFMIVSRGMDTASASSRLTFAFAKLTGLAARGH